MPTFPRCTAPLRPASPARTSPPARRRSTGNAGYGLQPCSDQLRLDMMPILLIAKRTIPVHNSSNIAQSINHATHTGETGCRFAAASLAANIVRAHDRGPARDLGTQKAAEFLRTRAQRLDTELDKGFAG